MIYPSNYEQKIGFDEIRRMLKGHCQSTLGQEKVDEMAFSDDASVVNEWQEQVREMRRLMQAQEKPEMNYFFDVRESVARIRLENTHLEENELWDLRWDLRRSLETIGIIVTFLNRGERLEVRGESIDDAQEEYLYPALHRMAEDVQTFPAMIRRIDSILDKFGRIKDSATMVLAGIRHDMEQTAGSISRTLYTILHAAQRDGLVNQDAAPTLRDGRNGYAATGASTDMTKLLEITAQFRKTFGDHNLSVLAGYSYQKMNYENQYEQNWDFPTDLYSYHNIGTGNALKEGLANMYSYKLESNLIGFFGRLNYSYKNRYLLMASIRHEAASQLAGTEKPWGTFPSVSLGWRITEEKFMENQKVFDDIKLRAGYGVTGSQPSQSFLGKSMLGYGDYYYYNGQWIQALQPTQNANPYLKWEEKHEYDVGVDFSVLNYRINVSIDWYYRLIKGLLYDYSVPSPPNLYTTTRANVGEMSNSGLEVMVNAIPVKTQKFEWNSTVTFSTNTNKLKSLSNELYQASSDYFMSGWIQEPVKTESHIVRIGHPVGEIYGFKVVDVDENGKWIYENKDGQLVGYDDFTHSFEDKKVLGNGLPKWHLGFNNTFRYKDWDLSVNMRGAFGFQIINCARMFYENRSRQDWNRLKSAYDKVFGKALLNTGCAEEFNSYYVENGDYWKIDNITLGYRFRNVCKFINSIRVYGSVNNALTITGYKGVDPEVSTSGLAPGYDNRDQYPHTRSFTVGANITF